METTWELYELFQAFLKAPAYHLALEALLFMWVLWLMFRKSMPLEATNVELTAKEKAELLADWKPEPLVPETPPDHYALTPRIVTGKVGKIVEVDGKQCLNLASHNYLGLVETLQVEEEAVNSLRKYGVGSCGPRGFFGTVDIHLDLETKLAQFMDVEEACLYSYGFSSVSSAIPAYSKHGDVIFADECSNFAIQKGLVASRSKLRYFKHNDMEDLERQLEEEAQKELKNPKKARVTRKFLVVEGIYMNTGKICPLPKLVELRKRYKLRMLIDESCSFGVLGRTGKGVREHFNIPNDEIDLMSATLEYAVGSYGGFCCGTSFVVDHQRLSGLGYCFSASLPPLQAAVSLLALDHLTKHLDLLSCLKENCQQMHKNLQSVPQLIVGGDDVSPVKHLYLAAKLSKQETSRKLEEVVNYAWKNGLALTVARYLDSQEHHSYEPSIRLTVTASLTPQDIDRACKTIQEACDSLL